MESFNGDGHLQHRRPPLFPSRMLDHLHVLRVFKKKCFPLLFQWWFSLLNVARVLQVWWKVAAHFGENFWLLVENIRRVGNKENPNPRILHPASCVCCSPILLPILNSVHWGPIELLTKNF